MNIYGMITTTKSAKYTNYAIESFYKNTVLSPEDQFILVNNDSTYDLPSNASYPQLTLERHDRPLSFSGNMNYFIQRAIDKKANLILCNNDIIFTKDWNIALETKDDALLSPLSNREIQLESDFLKLKVTMDIEEYLGHEDIFDKMADAYIQDKNSYYSVFAIPFFCIKIPHVILTTLGFSDESFGQAGGEDYDYCLRAQLSGFDVQYALGSYVLHFGGRSTYQVESKKDQIHREEIFSKRFLQKWGTQITDLILKEENSIIKKCNLEEIVERGDYTSAVKALLEKNTPSIKI